MASLVIASVYMAYEIIIIVEGIPCGLGGTDYTEGGALEVPIISVCVISI